ncbi:MAG TPA: hypothetical protein VJ773_08615 [Gemmatimonadales bacterium]|nr:hypothetical protein [Gemmatimonadales bacterium]
MLRITKDSARKALLSAATVLALATAACGGDDGGSTGPSDPPPPPEEESAMLKVNNQTTDLIAAVKIRLCGIGSFGGNLIGSNPIEGGTSATMEVPTGCYDVGVWSTPEVGQDAYKSGVIFIEGVTKELNLPAWP